MLTTTDTGDAPSQSAVAGNLAVGPGFRAGRVIGLFLLILALLDELYQAERRLLDGQIIDVPFTRLVTIAAEGLGNRVLPFEVERRGDITLGTVPSTLADSKDQPLSTTVVYSRKLQWDRSALSHDRRHPRPASVLADSTARIVSRFAPSVRAQPRTTSGVAVYMARHRDWIDVAHDQIAQGVMIVAVLLLWMQHVERVRSQQTVAGVS